MNIRQQFRPDIFILTSHFHISIWKQSNAETVLVTGIMKFLGLIQDTSDLVRKDKSLELLKDQREHFLPWAHFWYLWASVPCSPCRTCCFLSDGQDQRPENTFTWPDGTIWPDRPGPGRPPPAGAWLAGAEPSHFGCPPTAACSLGDSLRITNKTSSVPVTTKNI